MLIRPLFFKMEAETAHEIVCGVLSCADNIPVLKKITERLLCSPKDEKTVFGIRFPNALGLAKPKALGNLIPNTVFSSFGEHSKRSVIFFKTGMLSAQDKTPQTIS